MEFVVLINIHAHIHVNVNQDTRAHVVQLVITFFAYKKENVLNLNNLIFKAICNLNCINGGKCQLVNGNPQCQCPCLYSGSICQNCNLNMIFDRKIV